jgi:hypothetical protein
MKPGELIQEQQTAMDIAGASSCLEASSMLLKVRNIKGIELEAECYQLDVRFGGWMHAKSFTFPCYPDDERIGELSAGSIS